MIYIKEDLKFKELKIDNNSDIWEGQFVDILTEHIPLQNNNNRKYLQTTSRHQRQLSAIN